MMKTFDELTLVAYVDGELDAQAAHAVEEALRHDAALREEVRALRETTMMLKAAYADVLNEPVPLHLVRAISRAASEQPTAARPANAWRRMPGFAMAAAASVAMLVVGVTGGYMLGGRGAATQQVAVAPPAPAQPQLAAVDQHELAVKARDEAAARLVQVALEKEVSGTTVRWQNPDTGDLVTVTPIRTFKSEEGRYCREYKEVKAEPDSGEDIAFGLACRHPDGVWRVRYQLIPGEDAPAALKQ
jgi:surface antigen